MRPAAAGRESFGGGRGRRRGGVWGEWKQHQERARVAGGGGSRKRVLRAIVVEIDVQKRLPEERRVSGRMWKGSVGMGEGRFEWILNGVGSIWILMRWQISYI